MLQAIYVMALATSHIALSSFLELVPKIRIVIVYGRLDRIKQNGIIYCQKHERSQIVITYYYVTKLMSISIGPRDNGERVTVKPNRTQHSYSPTAPIP